MRKAIVSVASAGVLCALAAGTVHAAPHSCASSSRLVGKWAGTVFHGGTTGDISLVFTANGKACLITSAGVSRGTWKSTGGDFNFKITEALLDESGTQHGWIYIDQTTEGVSSTFTSSGTSLVYDMAGNFQFSQVADIDAHRVAGTPKC